MIPHRRFASAAGDQGVPMFEEAMEEWEVQRIASPPHHRSPAVQDVAVPVAVDVTEVQEIEGTSSSREGGDQDEPR
jgi:hypothetical protein